MRDFNYTPLLQLLLRKPIRVLFVLLGTFLQIALTLYLPVLIGKAIDTTLFAERANLVGLSVCALLVLFGNTFLQWCLPQVTNRFIYDAVATLREQVYCHLHRLPLSYLERHSSGDLLSRFSSDCEQLSSGLQLVFQQFFTGIVTILLTIYFMLGMDVWMMGLVVSLTPLSLIFAQYVTKRTVTYYRQQVKMRGEIAQLAEESIRQLSIIQSFNAQTQFQHQFKNVSDAYAMVSQKALFISSIVNPSTRFINALIYALLAGFGALRIMEGHFTVGTLTVFLTYASQYSKPFNDLSSVLPELQSALVCARRLIRILEVSPPVEVSGQESTEVAVEGSVRFEDVHFSYHSASPVITGLSIRVQPGQTVAVVGPTGAGKSTLINLLLRFYDPDKGQIFLDNHPITAYSKHSFRNQIGMVLQETWIKSGTIHDAIAYGYPQASREEVIKAAIATNADFFIRQLPSGYDTVLENGGEILSLGQRQLLSIARVFLRNPKILILDEATSSIDTRTEVLIQEALGKLMEGRTSFIIAHRLSTIQSADLILVLSDGKIVEQGNHASLMAKQGLYYQMQSGDGKEVEQSKITSPTGLDVEFSS